MKATIRDTVQHEVDFDVVTVPDFSGASSERFELLTLFFLAAWQENSGLAKRFPLHLACIGTPPGKVEKFAARVGAAISCHDPFGQEFPQTANKLRGLEVPTYTGQRLLLDTDVLILNDFSALTQLGGCIAAAPALSPRVPQEDWPTIYESVGQPLPQHKISGVLQELGIAPHEYDFIGQRAEFCAMLPYYNSGVLWTPTNIPLHQVWEAYLLRTTTLFPDEPRWRSVRYSDQAALAPAIEYFQQQAIQFRRLPATFHTLWPHIYAGQLGWRHVCLFHAFGFGRANYHNTLLRDNITAYQNHLWQQLRRALLRLPRRRQLWVLATRVAGWRYTIYRLGRHLEHLYGKYIEPLYDND